MSGRRNKQLRKQERQQLENQQKQQSSERRIIAQRTETSFSGPIPDPDSLEKYERLHPGAADRIIAMAESESTHRREMERKQLESDISSRPADYAEVKRGQICALVFGVFAVAAGAVIAVYGAPIAGTVLSAGALVSIMTAFIIGRKKQ